MKSWRTLENAFITNVCSQWKLPSPAVEISSAGAVGMIAETFLKTPKHEHAAKPSWDEAAVSCVAWESEKQRFQFFVDCLLLQKVACGHSLLLAGQLIPLFGRLLHDLCTVYEEGWALSNEVADPIVWKQREYNKLADYLCNETMDMRKSCLQEDCECGWTCQNIVIFSDGGVRSESVAASARYMSFATSLGTQNTEIHFIAARGIFIEYPVSSFVAETIALEFVYRLSTYFDVVALTAAI